MKRVKFLYLGEVEMPNYFPIPKDVSKDVMLAWKDSVKEQVLNDGKLEFIKFLLWCEKGKPPIKAWDDAFAIMKLKYEIMTDPERRKNALEVLSPEVREKAEKMFPAEEMEKQNV